MTGERTRLRRVSATCLLGAAIFLAGEPRWMLGAEVPAQGILPFSNLKLVLRVGKTEYLVGEPVDVYAELANPHQTPVEGRHGFAWFCEPDGGYRLVPGLTPQ